jgi:hypothetical protein
MTRWTILLSLAAAPAVAQSLDARIAHADGRVQFTFPSRGEVCGDGRTYLSGLMGNDHHVTYGDGITMGHRDAVTACVRGPARVVATVIGGEVTRLRTYVGPVPPPEPATADLGMVTAPEARTFLLQLVQRGADRAASDAVVPLIAVEGALPWPELLRVARDAERPRGIRHSVAPYPGRRDA